MKLSDFSVERPVTITMFVLAILLIGAVSLSKLPVDLYPEMNLPYVAIITNYPGASPEEIENTVTRPIEEVIATVDDIKSISSTSSAGNSQILIELDWGTQMDFATLDMREKIALVEEYLPEDVDKPTIFKADPSQMPIMQIGISSNGTLENLKQTTENLFKPNLERIPGVASVGINGGKEREIQINLDQQQLIAYGLTVDSLVSSIRQANLNLSGGSIVHGGKDLLLKTIGQFKSVEEIRNLEIKTPQGQKLALQDIATVKDTFKEIKSYSYLNGKQSIGLVIQKQSGSNTVQVSNVVKKELDKLKEKIKDTTEVEIVMNQAEFIEGSISSVKRNTIVGAILAILILFIFLRDIRSTFIIGTVIPISIVTAFTLMYFYDLTLNMMTLGGIALGVGMLVDNAIVVLENIYRHRQESESRIKAAKKGTAEVGTAILASTLTTAAVFLPLVYVEGLASQLFGSFALTVTFSLVASLVMALTLIPMLSSKLLKVKDEFTEGQEFQFGFITRSYRNLLETALKFRWLVALLVILGIVGFGVGIITKVIPLKAEFMPTTDEGAFSVDIELAEGKVIEETAQIVAKVEEQLKDVPEVNVIYSQIGGSNNMGIESTKSHEANISVELVDLNNRDKSTSEIVEELRGKMKDIAGAKIEVTAQSSMMGGGPSSSPIEIRIQGKDLEQLMAIGKDIVAEAKQVTGARNVNLSTSNSRPEIQVHIKRKIAKELGFSEAQIASTVKTAVKGQTVTKYKEAGEEFDITVNLKESETNTINKLKNLQLTSSKGLTVPLAQIAEISIEKGPNFIERYKQQRLVTVGVQLYGRSLGEVEQDIKTRVNKLNIPAGYTIEYGGQAKNMKESFGDLRFALILAIILVYMVMASQFESLIHPFTIMFTVPLALVGAVLSLSIVGSPLSVPGIIGMIMLAGIVVNNAIVLIDYINTRRQKESRKEAILNAGPIRLRPIMMTTLTTVLGLLPIALGRGEGAESQQPMAIVVVGGLLFSTILTLIIIPAIYSIIDDIANFVKVKFKKMIHGKEDILEV